MSVTVYLHEAGNVLNQEGQKIAEETKAKAQHPGDKKESQSWYNCYQYGVSMLLHFFFVHKFLINNAILLGYLCCTLVRESPLVVRFD